MPTITLEVPDELAERLIATGERLPEALARGLHQSTVPSAVYRYVLAFLANKPTPAQVAAFGPTPEMRDRLQALLERSQAGQLTPAEQAELDEYEQIEHILILMKAGALSYLMGAR